VTQPCVVVSWGPTRTRDADAAGLLRGRRNQLAAKETFAVERFDLRQFFKEGLVGAIHAIEVTDVVKSQRHQRPRRATVSDARQNSPDQFAIRRCAAAAMRSSVAVSAIRTYCAPEGP